MTHWDQHAACRGADTEKFFPMHRTEARHAIDGYCRVCPVVHECRDDAETGPRTSGVYGGDFWIDGTRIPGHTIKARQAPQAPKPRSEMALRAKAVTTYTATRDTYPSDAACYRAIAEQLGVHDRTVGKWIRIARDGARA